jgi:hypothetical protein
MKHIETSETWRTTLASVSERKKTFSQLDSQTKVNMARELGMDLNDNKVRGNIGRLWNRHRTDRAMIKEAKQLVAVDKAATARAAAAPAPPVPQASNDDDLAKAALVAATNANQAAANANQAVAKSNQTVENLAGTVGDLTDIAYHLKDVVSSHDNRLTNVETRQDATDGRLDEFQERLDTISKARLGQSSQRQQQQPDPTIIATPSGSGWASPCSSPSNSSPANAATPPVFVGATKKTPTSPSSPASGSFGAPDHAPSNSTDAVATPAPAFGASFTQYKGFDTAVAPAAGGGGWGPSPLSSQGNVDDDGVVEVAGGVGDEEAPGAADLFQFRGVPDFDNAAPMLSDAAISFTKNSNLLLGGFAAAMAAMTTQPSSEPNAN